MLECTTGMRPEVKNVGPHNVSPRSIERRNTHAAPLGRKAREKLGNGLRAAYNDVREWELPERLRVLLDQLTRKNSPPDRD